MPSLGQTGTRAVGAAALGFSVLYLATDVIEELQGGFSDWQLWLTLIAELAIPVFVIGLYLAQRPRIGRLGLISAVVYAYAFLFFSYTVVYALAEGTPDYDTLTDEIGAAMTIHGVLMVLAGIGFGWATIRAGVLPAWTGACLALGVVLVAATQSTAAGPELIAAGVRDLGWAGMGAALLLAPRGSTAPGRAAG